ncbi:MAG TPA: hypothetical protein VHW26_06850 [Solirubrobacteraceae bacterium]|jgi:hypothetical protein|nr:hypothetical protein [Solirubrobacteraceae bacterium]
MTPASGSPARRAERLARWYPAAWRERYADEFTQLLIDDITERPRSWSRTADVVRSGTLARLTEAGLTGDALDPTQQVRAGLAGAGFAVAGFLVVGIAIWSQLTIGWQWSAPAAPATRFAMLVMSAMIACFLGLAALAAPPVAWALGRGLADRQRRRHLLGPLVTAATGATVFAVGSHHFGAGWPGTGGHPWAHSGLVPGSIASVGWASTLWVTSYWAHPGALSSFPVAEIAWMAASPAALLTFLLGTTRTLRRLPLSAGVLRYETWLAGAAALAMVGFLAGAGSWVISGGPAPRGLFRVGAIDDVGLVAMTAAVLVGFRAAQRAVTAAAACRQTRRALDR